MDSEEEDDHHSNQSDEYLDDSLPDLVLDACSNAYENKSVSSIDLLALVSNRSSKERNASSASDLPREVEAEETAWDEEEYLRAGHEIVTEVSSSSQGKSIFKVSYVDHSKAYIPRMSHSDKYLSYLSLMPEDNDHDHDKDLPTEDRKEQILFEFRALSFEDQRQQRLEWAQELEKTENEILELRERLAFKTAWCGVMRRNIQGGKGRLGWREGWQAAEQKLEAISMQSLQKAKESFEVLANEVRGRMRIIGESKIKNELVRKVANLKEGRRESPGKEVFPVISGKELVGEKDKEKVMTDVQKES